MKKMIIGLGLVGLMSVSSIVGASGFKPASPLLPEYKKQEYHQCILGEQAKLKLISQHSLKNRKGERLQHAQQLMKDLTERKYIKNPCYEEFDFWITHNLPKSSPTESVNVKYGNRVSLDTFKCQYTNPSEMGIVRRICYDANKSYALVKLVRTYYHYCNVPSSVITQWNAASSAKDFYKNNIKGNFDCRLGGIPTY